MGQCKDCKWMDEPGEFAKCNAPQNIIGTESGFDVVARRWTHCTTQRSEGWFAAWLTKSCGKAGRWFEPKETK